MIKYRVFGCSLVQQKPNRPPLTCDRGIRPKRVTCWIKISFVPVIPERANTQRSVRAYVHAVTRTHRQQHARASRECNVLLPSIRLFYIDLGTRLNVRA